ncbi:hypothetical protein RHI9324_05026 [Rhizobium sp. CECT 9324]|nr:hypothetical protein RHI9324_05026 [Rhizobium sp. CECT 9324]
MIQPTHASSRVGGLPSDSSGAPFFWRERVEEFRAILDHLAEIERQAPAVSGRLDHSRIAAAGHSFGGHTVGLVLGAQLNDEVFYDPRISAGILLAAPGRRGKNMTEENATRFPFFDVDFSTMTTRSLVVCGDADDPYFTNRGPEWHADAFHDAPGASALLMLDGAKETETEAPDQLEALRRLTLAWIQTALRADEGAWPSACLALEGKAAPLADVTQGYH